MPKPQQKWTQETLLLALDACQQDKISMNRISKLYGIPRATLFDKLTGRRKLEQVKTTVLSQEEEIEIVTWVYNMSLRGFGQTKSDLLLTVKKYLDFKGRSTRWPDNRPGAMWLRLFKRRHPDIIFRKARKLGKTRALITESALKAWWDNLRETVSNIDASIFLYPDRIFNADETGFHLDVPSGKVLAFIEDKYTYQISQETKTMITTLISANAAGYFIHPLLIYPPTQFHGFAPQDMFSDCLVTTSVNGWIIKDLFADWLEHKFIPQTAHIKKPILLLIDNHGSHQSIRASQLCAENDIILYASLPHASHLIQPLDVGVFSHLKASWRDVVRHRAEADVITKQSFADAFQEAFEATKNNKNAVFQGFKKSGIFPLNFNEIDLSNLVSTPSENPSPDLPEHSEKSPSFSPASIPQCSPPAPTSLSTMQIATATSSSSTSFQLIPMTSTNTTIKPSTSSQSLSLGYSPEASSSSTDGGSLRKLLILASQVGEERTLQYLQRLDKGYDITGLDMTFDLFKTYYKCVREGGSSNSNCISVQSAQQLDKDKVEAERKTQREKELKEKKKKTLEEKERKQRIRERKLVLERKKKEPGERKVKIPEERRKRKEKVLEEKKSKKQLLKKRKGEREIVLSSTDEGSDEEIVLDSGDIMSVDKILERDRKMKSDEENVCDSDNKKEEVRKDNQEEVMQIVDKEEVEDDLCLIMATQQQKKSCIVRGIDEKGVDWIECLECCTWHHYGCSKVIS